jgi:hypothetical protein
MNIPQRSRHPRALFGLQWRIGRLFVGITLFRWRRSAPLAYRSRLDKGGGALEARSLSLRREMSAMILRVFRAIVHEDKQAEFRQFFLHTALPGVRAHAGLETVSVGLPHETSPTEFSMVMVWRDLDALKEFTGDNWLEPVIHPDEVHLLKETHVHHYETGPDLSCG